MEMIQTFSEEAASLANKVKTYSDYQDCFDDTQSHMHSFNVEEITQIVLSEISDIEYDLTLRKLLWDAQEEWGTLFQEWRKRTLHSIDIDLVQRNVSNWMNIIFVLEKGSKSFVLKSFHQGLHSKWPLGQWDQCPWPDFFTYFKGWPLMARETVQEYR